ncbi:MAG: diaminopimelate epimerase [Clostridia bacterium]|nr:diaminopimelate epimerase [Clostridia bacterium]
MKLSFVKMQGAGNDYLFFDGFTQEIKDPASLSVRLSPRGLSVGSDGIILVLPAESGDHDAKMRIFNADGSEAEMCGNGVRCVAKFLYEERGVKKDVLKIETLGGLKTVGVSVEDGRVTSARVAMGEADFALSAVTKTPDAPELIDRPVRVGESTMRLTALSVGNPHAVSFWEDIENLDLPRIGPAVENHPLFSERINAEFVRVISPTSLDIRIWERGSGETLACGTGVSASVAAAVRLGICKKNTRVNVRVRGGLLAVEVTDDGIFLTGPCVTVYHGSVEA